MAPDIQPVAGDQVSVDATHPGRQHDLSNGQLDPTARPPKKALALIVALTVFAALGLGFVVERWWWGHAKPPPNQLTLYGNVDLRQVELAFNDSERIAEVLVQEGDKVMRGQILARLDTSRLKPQAAAAEAEVEAQQAVVQKLHHGSRPEEIAQAKANVASAKADLVNAEQQWNRMTALCRVNHRPGHQPARPR